VLDVEAAEDIVEEVLVEDEIVEESVEVEAALPKISNLIP